MKYHNKMFSRIVAVVIFISILFNANCSKQTKGKEEMGLSETVQKKTTQALIEKFGEEHKSRIEKGVQQVAMRWKTSDGSETDFEEFCMKNFAAKSDNLDVIFSRYQTNLETLYGNLHRINRRFNWALQIEIGPVHPVDYLFANYNPYAHLSEDLFKTKLAFIPLLNYPLLTLKEKYEQGAEWSRKKWAEVRLVEQFSSRIPADIAQKRSEVYTVADDYISNYNIYMHNLLDEKGNRLFPEGLKLITHWGLRDELKAHYANPEGFDRQKMIYEVMKHIIHQDIPQKVINNDKFDWNPYTNNIYEHDKDNVVEFSAEPNTRYQHIINIFNAERMLDPYYPEAPSLIDRRFKLMREMLEEDVESLLTSVVGAPVLKDIAKIIEDRLGRPLESWDIWYNGFKPRSKYSEEQLDVLVGERYPDVQSFQKDLPYILRNLGFSPEKAAFLANHIQVDPSRGAGHASGAAMREDKAHLRTRIPEAGMKYKGFNIAIHELGHNVEQVFSLNEIDYYTLEGVPNTAFTEAFAFVFQSRDLQVLGLTSHSEEAELLDALQTMWSTFEIAGVALTDMYIWRWMYENPEATPEQMRAAMLNTAKQVWNKYFTPVLGKQDVDILCIYSHIVDLAMYTPDYPLGHLISFQIEQYLKEHSLAEEMERMCRLGDLAPQIWMQEAVGQEVSAQPLLIAAENAVKSFSNK